MIEGWFNAFREYGGPTWYGDHRTSVVFDLTTAKIVVIFSVFLITFLIIFPGVRRRKLSSFPTTVHVLFIGASILIAHFYPCWQQAHVSIFAPYRSFSSEHVFGVLGIHIGLSYANITLHGTTEKNQNDAMNHNERIYFTDVKTMQQNLMDALRKGLPFPIITVVEYFAVEKAGFVWGRGYRLAGYYTDFILWISFSLWCVMVSVVCALPRLFSRTLIATGFCLCTANVVYAIACPKHLCIPFPDLNDMYTRVIFRFGWCFWLILATGTSCLLTGIVIRAAEVNYSCEFKTFLQSDYEEMSNATASSREEQKGLDSNDDKIFVRANGFCAQIECSLADRGKSNAEVGKSSPQLRCSDVHLNMNGRSASDVTTIQRL